MLTRLSLVLACAIATLSVGAVTAARADVPPAEAERLPVPVAERPLTLPAFVLAPNASLDTLRFGTFGSYSRLTVGADSGITDSLSIRAVVLPLQLSGPASLDEGLHYGQSPTLEALALRARPHVAAHGDVFRCGGHPKGPEVSRRDRGRPERTSHDDAAARWKAGHVSDWRSPRRVHFDGMPASGSGTRPSTKRASASKPTPAQQRARREYVRRTGHKVSAERVEKIRSQWQG
jgi:hypothetical protein